MSFLSNILSAIKRAIHLPKDKDRLIDYLSSAERKTLADDVDAVVNRVIDSNAGKLAGVGAALAAAITKIIPISAPPALVSLALAGLTSYVDSVIATKIDPVTAKAKVKAYIYARFGVSA